MTPQLQVFHEAAARISMSFSWLRKLQKGFVDDLTIQPRSTWVSKWELRGMSIMVVPQAFSQKKTKASLYGRPFVSNLWHDICVVFSHVYMQFSLLWGFFPQVFVHFLLMRPLTQVCICSQRKPYLRTTQAIYVHYKQTCIYGVIAGRCIRGTIELKSYLSLNQTWPQWPR